MNTQKPDNKSTDPEDGDHAQPINLVAARTPVPVSTFSAPSTTTSSPTLPMRTHLESKSGMMTLYFRTQAPRTPGQMIGPIVGTQVSSSQHFTAKPAQDFKNTPSFTVIRMPSDLAQVQGGGATTSSSASPAILPASLSSGNNRHIIPAAVQPVIAASHSGPALASLIRGSPHQVTPAGHVIHPPFSSHVPRGPAAVASISAAPKSAVATPILRTPHSSATMALASSSMMALHTPVRVKSPTLASRTATPPASSVPQVIDLQKTSIGHSMPSTVSHVGIGARTMDGSIVRSGGSHASSITIAKPVNISQPIVQHLQQVYDKGTLKTVSNLVPATSVSVSASSYMSTPSAFISVTETSGVTTISRPPSSTSYSSIMQLSSQAGGHVTGQQTLRVTPHVGQNIHTLSTTASSGSHQTLTVIAAKSLMPVTNHSISLAAPTPRSATPITSVSAASGNISIVPGPTPRSLTITNNITPTTIPVAKVYPQSTSISRATPENTNQEAGVRQTGSFMQGVSRSTTDTSNQEAVRTGSFIMQNINSNNVRMATPTTTAGSSAVIADIPERSQSGVGSSYTPSSTTYLYHDQYASNLAMHQYNPNTASQGFTTQLRPISFSQHSSSHPSTHSSLSLSNPVMVAVDSRHHLQLRSPYVPSTGKAVDTVTPVSMPSAGITTNVSSAPSSVVSTSYNTLQTQSTANNNHTSPRPSILRKRPSENICNVTAKKNLSAALSTSEFISNRPDGSGSHFSTVLSPKPVRLSESSSSTPSITDKRGSTVLLFPASNESFSNSNEKPKDIPSVPSMVAENQNILIPVIPAIQIKKEIDTENSNPPSESCPIETSPRKKPRKQQLSTNELMETHSSDGEENSMDTKIKIKEEPDDEKSKFITYYKRPNMSLLSTLRQTWKPRHNHFGRYNDVKPKEEKKLTVSELANQKGILQQANGWKVYHLTAQMDEVTGIEESVYTQLSDLLQFVEGDTPPLRHHNLHSDEVRIINKLTDLIKGNLQRSKIVQEQVAESKQQAIKVLDHKSNVAEMVTKYISKRPLKKKDKS